MRGRLAGIALLLPAILLAAGCASSIRPAGAGPEAPEIRYIGKDTTWSGDVRVGGVVQVRKGATLTLLPGTRVIFLNRKFGAADEHEGFSAPGIHVEGRIQAVGTEGAPIRFTGEGTPAPGTWDKILFTFSEGSRFDRCVFEGARYAIHSHFSGIDIRRSIFRDNEEGVRLGVSRVRIEESVFTRNLVRGINFRDSRNEIRKNLVYGNGDGIFVHSKGGRSVVRENAIYGNLRFNLRLGDLHADDFDASGNWWGAATEGEVRRAIHDGANTPGVGAVRLAPLLAGPPATGAEIRGIVTARRLPVAGARVRALVSISRGFDGEESAAEVRTDESGRFRLAVPPGRYFVVGKADSGGKPLFTFPGRNPVSVEFGESVEVGLPAVLVPESSAPRFSPAPRTFIRVRATLEGTPVSGAIVQASRPDRPDFRGPGDAAAATDEAGYATLYLPAGKYVLSVKKRISGAPFGMVDEGGIFGVSPYSPVELPAGQGVTVEIPVFEKAGWIGPPGEGDSVESAPPTRDGRYTIPGDAAGGRPPASTFPHGTIGGNVSGRIVLSGKILVTEDLLVLPGAILEVLPGSELLFSKSESSKVDPELFFGGTELVVRGKLIADGAKLAFRERTGGIVVDGGNASMKDTVISGAETGLAIVHGGEVRIDGKVTVQDCRTGVALFPGPGTAMSGSGILTARGNGVGAVRFQGAPEIPSVLRTEASEETATIAWGAPVSGTDPAISPGPSPAPDARRIGDTLLDADRTLEGDVVVDGIVRVAPGVTLTILPGSRLFFTFRDTDGDGIGENGLFLQGNLRAKGTASLPIGFYPAEGDRPGSWDSINFMASDRGENILEHVEIAGAYRGVHAHFSRLTGNDVRIFRCYRGVQFQESEVGLTDLAISRSSSGLRCRDSEVRIEGIRMEETFSGGNFFRSRVSMKGASVAGTGWYGFRFRESRVEWAGGEVTRALVGVSIQDGTVRADSVRVADAGLAGAAVQDGDVNITASRFEGSFLDGLTATRGALTVDGGVIRGFGRHAVKLSGPAAVTLRGVSLPPDGGGPGAVRFLDGNASAGLGVVRVE